MDENTQTTEETQAATQTEETVNAGTEEATQVADGDTDGETQSEVKAESNSTVEENLPPAIEEEVATPKTTSSLRDYGKTEAALTVSPVVENGEDIGFACRVMEPFQVDGNEFEAGDYLLVDKDGGRGGLSVANFEESGLKWDCSRKSRTQPNGGPA